jgi:hypothetical protein
MMWSTAAVVLALVCLAAGQGENDLAVLLDNDVENDTHEHGEHLHEGTDNAIQTEGQLVNVDAHSEEDHAGCGCGAGTLVQNLAQRMLSSLLSDLSQNVHQDVSPYFVSGTTPADLSDIQTHVESVKFETPEYVVSEPNVVVANVGWTYRLNGSSEEYNDGSLVMLLRTSERAALISELRVVHDNENYNGRLPATRPNTVLGLYEEFITGIDALNHQEAITNVHEDFTVSFRGRTSLLPDQLPTSATLQDIKEFKSEFNEVFGSTAKSLQCTPVAQTETTAVLSCTLQLKHHRVKRVVDVVATAESRDGLLSSIVFYVVGESQETEAERQARIAKEEEAVEAERLKREKREQEAKRKEEEAKRKEEEAAAKQQKKEEERLRKEEAAASHAEDTSADTHEKKGKKEKGEKGKKEKKK